MTNSHHPSEKARGLALPLLAPLLVIGFDIWNHPFLFHGYGSRAAATYVATALLSFVMWWAWGSLVMNERRSARIVGAFFLVVGGTAIIGAQRYVLDRFGVLIDESYLRWGSSNSGNAGSVLWNDKWTLARAVVPPLVAFSVLVFALSRLRTRTRVRPARVRILAPIAALTTFIAVSYASPSRFAEGAEPLDVLCFSALGQFARGEVKGSTTATPGRRTPQPIPSLKDAVSPATGTRRNVVLFVTESVRAQSTCLDLASGCAETPFSHRAAPNRIVFPQMHSLASNTLPSVTAIWSGLGPASSREVLHRAPLVWEYAHAADYDTAYWTAQDFSYGNMQTFLDGVPMHHLVSASDLDRERDSLVGADEHLLTNHVQAHVKDLREPFMVVIHLSNTHLPYRVDLDDLPFVPQSTEGANGNETMVLNRYKDAIYAQDKLVARMIKAFRDLPSAAQTVMLFTSDHGEQFRERGAVGHSQTLSEEEVHVPFWVDAPEGALTAEERTNLKAATKDTLTHAMMLPTMLDLMGIYDAPQIASLRAPMLGGSLLRANTDLPAVVLTNCSGMNACPRPTWGAMKGHLKVWANDADQSWNCHDLRTDPNEKQRSTGTACAELASIAEGSGRGVPFRLDR